VTINLEEVRIMAHKKLLFSCVAGLTLAMMFGFAVIAAKSSVSFTYFGQACFMISAPGVTIAMDPYGKIGYPPLHLKADVVTVSHEHADHNNVNAVSGNPVVLRGLTPGGDWARVSRTVKGARFRTVHVFHDANGGKDRGKNAIFVLTVGGLHIVHIGDLGKQLTPAQLKEIGPVDVLLVPVGGYYTIDAAGAAQVVRAIKPRVVIPMHYKTDATRKLPISTEAEFMKRFKTVRRAGHTLELSPDSLPKETTVYHMEPH
jgi:L-ascorbate metabolism protein UlaG (beta-lactamase superfamily)